MKYIYCITTALILGLICFTAISQEVSYSTYFGGSGDEYMPVVTRDITENIIIAFRTTSTDLPIVGNAISKSYLGGANDIFVIKLNKTADEVLASTYLGGSDEEFCTSILCDTNNNIYLSGVTRSEDFHHTKQAYDTTYNGCPVNWGGDLFIMKINNNLDSIIASTYFGGSNMDNGGSIKITDNGEIVISGTTASVDFPRCETGYSKQLNGIVDGFISKLNSDLTELIASTYIGGEGNDWARGIEINESGEVYITLHGQSGFPVTSEAYQIEFKGEDDVFIGKFSSDLSQLISSSYIGGTGAEIPYTLKCSKKNGDDIYLACITQSDDLPVSDNAIDNSYENKGNLFLACFDKDLTTLKAASYFGQELGIMGDFILNENDDIFFFGYTEYNNLLTTPTAFSKTYKGKGDNFIIKTNSDFTQLDYCSYLGGTNEESNDFNSVLLFENDSNLIIISNSKSDDFLPVNDKSIFNSHQGGNDIFLININILKENKSVLVKNNLVKKLLVYPNPTQNNLQIEYPGLEQKKISYKIIDLSGKTLQQGKLAGNTIDVSKVCKGTYIMNLKDGGESLNQKFIIE